MSLVSNSIVRVAYIMEYYKSVNICKLDTMYNGLLYIYIIIFLIPIELQKMMNRNV